MAVTEGTADPALREVEVVLRPALGATASDVLAADGLLLGSPVNLGYISGALKHFFDQVYYPCLEATRGRPFGVWLHGDNDAGGALRAIQSITTGLGWKLGQAPLVVTGPVGAADLAACREMGAAVAAQLLLDL
jgi:multimeric flavodoxin WrbA